MTDDTCVAEQSLHVGLGHRGDARIIRHRGKIEATIQNARATLALDEPLDRVLWSFAPAPRAASPVSFSEVPATTPESVAMSKTLRKLGFRFVGPTTMYALMQAAGMVDDHLAECFRASADFRGDRVAIGA